jgi:hypothetical protein
MVASETDQDRKNPYDLAGKELKSFPYFKRRMKWEDTYSPVLGRITYTKYNKRELHSLLYWEVR